MSVPTDEIADLLKYLSCVPVDGLAENFVSIFARQLMGSHDYLTHRTGSVENSDEIPLPGWEMCRIKGNMTQASAG